MSAVHVQLLGPVALVVDGQPTSLGGARQRALVAYLALHRDRALPTAAVVEQVWGSEAPRTVVKSMSTLLSRVRPLLEPHGIAITFTDAGYQLTGPPGAVDVQEFRSAVDRSRLAGLEGDPATAAEALEAALALWQGPALATIDSPFAAAARSSLGVERQAAMAELASLHLVLGRADAAVELLRELAEVAPLREDRQLELMRALTRAGRGDEALVVYQELRERLGDELGLEPGEPIEAARRDAASGADIVGRDEQLDVLEEALQAAVRREMQVVLVTGEPGAGKSHLVRTFIDRVAARGFAALLGRSEPTATMPLHSFLQILEQVADRGLVEGIDDPDTYPTLRSLLDDERPDPAGDQGDLRRRLLLREIGAVVTRLAAQAPLIVVVEDFHNADPLTLAALHAMTYDGSGLPVMLVLTAREQELFERELAEVAMAEVAARGYLRKITLEPLGPDQVADLVARSHPEVAADPALLALVEAGAGGNPLYVGLLAKHVADHPDPSAPLPTDVVELVRARLDPIPDRGRDLLLAASVLGQEFTLDEAGALLTDDQRELQLRTVEASHSGLLEVAPGGRHRFVHGIVQRVAYEMAPDALRAVLHKRAARLREKTSTGDLEVLHHLLYARPLATDDEVAERVLAAARRSIGHGVFETAVGVLRAADELDLTPARAAEAAVLRGIARIASGDAAGLAVLDAGVDAARTIGRWDLVADGLVGRARAGRLTTLTDAERYIGALTEVIERGRFDERRTVVLLCLRAEAVLTIDFSRAAEDLSRAEAIAADLDDDGASQRRIRRVRALELAAKGGAAAEVERQMVAVVEDAVAADDLAGAAIAAQTVQAARLRNGDLRACLTDQGRFERLAQQSGRTEVSYQLRAQKVGLSIATDPVPVAAGLAAGLAADPAGPSVELAWVTQVMHTWNTRRELGTLGELEEIYGAFAASAARPAVAALHAACLLELGQLDRARTVLAPIARAILDKPRDWADTTALAIVVDLALDLGHAIELDEIRPVLATAAGELVVLGGSMLVLGRVDRYLGRLEWLAGDLDAAVVHLARARELDRDAGAGLWAAWAARDEALVRMARGGEGDAELAVRLLDDAVRTGRRYGSVRLVRAVQERS